MNHIRSSIATLTRYTCTSDGKKNTAIKIDKEKR